MQLLLGDAGIAAPQFYVLEKSTQNWKISDPNLSHDWLIIGR